jgi:hypothetical protein
MTLSEAVTARCRDVSGIDRTGEAVQAPPRRGARRKPARAAARGPRRGRRRRRSPRCWSRRAGSPVPGGSPRPRRPMRSRRSTRANPRDVFRRHGGADRASACAAGAPPAGAAGDRGAHARSRAARPPVWRPRARRAGPRVTPPHPGCTCCSASGSTRAGSSCARSTAAAFRTLSTRAVAHEPPGTDRAVGVEPGRAQ